MGLFDIFKSRRQRESAIPPSQVEAIQKPTESEKVGQAFPTEQATQFNGQLDLGQMIGMFRDAAKSGQPQIAIGEAKAINAQGTDLGNQIREVMSQHGISENMHPGEAANVSDPQEMQKQIMDVLSQHGLDFSKLAGGNMKFTVDTGKVDAAPDTPDPS